MIKKIGLLALALISLISVAGAADLTWQTDLPKALAQAKAEKKLVLIDFTGSDWCVWCKKQDKDTFAQPEFADYALKKLVLVQLDYPQQKPQSDELKKANKDLATKYSIEGFPTMIALNADGTEAWRNVGYLDGGPKAIIEKLEAIAKP